MRKTYREPGTMKRRIYHLVPRRPLVPSIDATTLEEEPDPIVRSTSPPFQSTSYVEEKVGKWWLDTGSYPSLRNYDGVSWAGILKVWVLEVGDYLKVGSGTVDVDLTGLYVDRSKFQAQNAGTDQVWIDITTGKFYAGAGALMLDAVGLTLVEGTATPSQVKWVYDGATFAYVSADRAASDDDRTLYVWCDPGTGNALVRINAGLDGLYDPWVGLDVDLDDGITLDPREARVSTNINLLGKTVLGAPTELTIASGAITVTQSNHIIDTENDDATDDLVTINGGVEGMLLFLRTAHNDRDVTIKNGTGNITCGADFTHDRVADFSTYIYRGTDWYAFAPPQSNA